MAIGCKYFGLLRNSYLLGKTKRKKFFQESYKSRGLNIAISQKTNCRGNKKSQKSRDFSRDN